MCYLYIYYVSCIFVNVFIFLFSCVNSIFVTCWCFFVAQIKADRCSSFTPHSRTPSPPSRHSPFHLPCVSRRARSPSLLQRPSCRPTPRSRAHEWPLLGDVRSACGGAARDGGYVWGYGHRDDVHGVWAGPGDAGSTRQLLQPRPGRRVSVNGTFNLHSEFWDILLQESRVNIWVDNIFYKSRSFPN